LCCCRSTGGYRVLWSSQLTSCRVRYSSGERTVPAHPLGGRPPGTGCEIFEQCRAVVLVSNQHSYWSPWPGVGSGATRRRMAGGGDGGRDEPASDTLVSVVKPSPRSPPYCGPPTTIGVGGRVGPKPRSGRCSSKVVAVVLVAPIHHASIQALRAREGTRAGGVGEC